MCSSEWVCVVPEGMRIVYIERFGKRALEDASPSPRSKLRGRSTRLSYIRKKIRRGSQEAQRESEKLRQKHTLQTFLGLEFLFYILFSMVDRICILFFFLWFFRLWTWANSFLYCSGISNKKTYSRHTGYIFEWIIDLGPILSFFQWGDLGLTNKTWQWDFPWTLIKAWDPYKLMKTS